MKIKPQDLAVLQKYIAAAVADHLTKEALYKAAGLSHMRYRWDMLWRTKLRIGDGAGAPGDLDLYAYMNDDHIDTALRYLLGSQYP